MKKIVIALVAVVLLVGGFFVVYRVVRNRADIPPAVVSPGPGDGGAPSDGATDGAPDAVLNIPMFDYAKAAAYSTARKGISFLVMKDGKVVYEQYAAPKVATTPTRIASGTKSFSCALLVSAIQDGLVSGFDEKVSRTIEEWQGDPAKKDITLRQLLNLTSGIPGGKIGSVPTYAEAITTLANATPGTKFQYGPLPFQIFGEVMERKLSLRQYDPIARGQGPLGYLTQKVLDPIGLIVGDWRRGKDGNPNMPSGAFLTAREWIKYGELVKNGGAYGGEQILKGDLFDECLKGSSANPGYGVTFWLNAAIPAGFNPADIEGVRTAKDTVSRFLSDDAPSDLFMAAGAGNQRLYVIPSWNMVIVRQSTGGEYSDNDFFKALLGK